MKLLLFLILFFPKEYIGVGYLVSVEREELNIVRTMDPEEVNEIVENNLNIDFDVEQVLDTINSVEFYLEGELDVYVEKKDVYMKRNKLIYRKK